MLELTWKNMTTREAVDIREEVKAAIREGEHIIHIGTDAQLIDRKVRFATCVVILKPRKGGRVFYTTQALPKEECKGLRNKLFKETWYSLQTAMDLEPYIPEEYKVVIHVDANTNSRWESSAYLQELVGMVVGQGFEYLAKPDAWCSSHAADHCVKGKNIR
jgi:predicted RNase H-related nuclease YkuK (DUF458 family)